MAVEVEDVLSLMREAEQLLAEMPEHAPDRVFVSAELVNLRRIYLELTDASDVAAHVLSAADRTVADAQLLFACLRAQLDKA